MKKPITSLLSGLTLIACSTLAQAGGHLNWTLDSEASAVSFGSVKVDVVGEVNHFESIAGSISEQGDVNVEIDVASVQTNIDIRNERILEWVLNGAPTATLEAQIDMAMVNALAAGDTTLMDVAGTLGVNGVSLDVSASFFVAKLSDSKLLVTTADMIMLSVDAAGLTAGVDKLMELAGLPSITRVSPVTLRMVFELSA
ncbi:MAG: YceI family protein [Pseudomonadota bacterium]